MVNVMIHDVCLRLVCSCTFCKVHALYSYCIRWLLVVALVAVDLKHGFEVLYNCGTTVDVSNLSHTFRLIRQSHSS